MLRILVVDDEAPARRYLKRLLQAASGVEVVGEAATLDEARRALRELEPDALFLDIALTCGSGFDLLTDLAPTPAVVFVTAHPHFATRAFDVQAVDYLLKPVSPERLAQTLARLRPYVALDMRTRTGKRYIKAQELSVVQAQGDYVMLFSADHGNELVHTTLKRLAEQLPAPPFCMLSRSVILNLDHVSQVSSQPGNAVEVAFTNGVAPLTLGRAAAQRLRRALGAPRAPAATAYQNGTTIFSVTP